MSDSMWKKDLSFKRKPKGDVEPEAEVDVENGPAPADAPKQSFLKKEISFSRKPKDSAEPAVVALPPTSEKAPKQSFLKKDVSFSRKKRDTEVDRLVHEAAQSLSPTFAPAESATAETLPTALAEAAVAAMAHADAQAEAQAQADAQARAAAQAEADAQARAQALARSEAEAQAQAEAFAQREAEAQELAAARAQAEAEAQADAHAQAFTEAPAPAEDTHAPEATAPEPPVAEQQAPTPSMFVEHPAAAAPVEPVTLAAVPDPEPVDLHVVAPLAAEPQSYDAPTLEQVPGAPGHDAHAVPVLAVDEPEADVGLAPATFGRPHADEAAPAAAVESPPLTFMAPVAPVAAEPPPVGPVAFEPATPVEPDPVEPAAYEPVVAEPVPAAPVAAQPAEPAAYEPVAAEPEPWLAAAPVEPAESWLAEPELPAAPEASPVTIHPPVSAAELPPLVDAVPSGPFWKKELSFSRKPKAPKVPKAELAQKDAATPKVPFWKKELGGKKKSAPPVEGVVAAAPTDVLPAAPKVPFWKKELGGKKKSAAPVEGAVAAAPAEPLPAGPKVPFWKKELGGKKKSAAPATAAAATAAPLPAGKPVPFWKKLSLPSFSFPGRSSGGGKSGGHTVKKLVGLKIGSSQLAAARVSNNGVAEVQQLAREALAAGIVVGGELRDPEALGEALKGFFARNKLPKKGVRLGIASNRIGVRIFDIVGVTEDKQLANAIHFRAQETLPIPLDEAVLDFRVLDEHVDEEGQSVKRVLLVVVYRELVERYVSACKKAGIQLAGIDLEAFALLRSLAPPVDRGSSALVGVAIGYDRSTFAVSDGRVCEFTRVLEWGGSSLNVALARTFDSTPSEVEAIKRSLSLDDTVSPPGLTPEQTAQAIDAVRRQVQSFARELVSSLQFYQNQPGSLGIGEIVLTGGTTHLPGLAAELERLIGVHVRVGDPFARVKISKRLEDGMEQSGSMAVAIGLGIED
jgi:type IV pilus assembly protein PilM